MIRFQVIKHLQVIFQFEVKENERIFMTKAVFGFFNMYSPPGSLSATVYTNAGLSNWKPQLACSIKLFLYLINLYVFETQATF